MTQTSSKSIILKRIIIVVSAALLGAAGFFLYLMHKDPNPNLTGEQIRELDQLYLDNYIQEEDFRIISELGMNTVRIPFTCYNLTEDGYTLREDAFDKLDWAVDMCAKYGLYAVIDLHGAVGSQNQDVHSGDDAQYALYGNARNEESTIELWKAIAAHYRGNKSVAAYDLLNEPRRAPGKFWGKVNFDFYDRLYKAVREVDPEHLILIECFSFPVNGVRLSGYDWENICIEYHICNLFGTEFAEKAAVYGYWRDYLAGECSDVGVRWCGRVGGAASSGGGASEWNSAEE